MPQQVTTAVENNFTKGLITESTGLNFPENAATDTDNCLYTLVGDVTRREGIDLEENFSFVSIDRTGKAFTSYKWNNAGGSGSVQLVVTQVGNILYFWSVTNSTTASPLSNNRLASTIDLSTFSTSFNNFIECTFADGNGYLFIFHPNCDPVYCTYNAGVITGVSINVQTRDFVGISEPGVSVNTRPNSLSAEHKYNLNNQGWGKSPPWSATSSDNVPTTVGSQSFTVGLGLSVTNGDTVGLTSTAVGFPGGVYQPAGSFIMAGTVTGYAAGIVTINITSVNSVWGGSSWNAWLIQSSADYITQWKTAIGNYPSNADVWWNYKDSTDVFNPTTTINNVTISSSPANKGHYVLSAFNQQRSLVSGISGLTDVISSLRPRTGTWFQGRIWYAGVDAVQAATGDAAFTNWTETIYFSQVVVDPTDFGQCYQENDPTSETLFDLLSTDGGTIVIQGCGSVYKLFPVQNGMLVFAANGVWFITGSQGIGFTANDYTITKISNVQSISSTSFVDVLGLPLFWNEEGIYQVEAQQNGSLAVNAITVSTILSFFNSIPLSSKKYVRGAYHPIDYVVQWIYKSTEETSVTDRYAFDKILNFNTYNKAFFPYTVSNTAVSINGINYVSGPGGLNTVEPGFKYLSSVSGTVLTFADERDTNYVDWNSAAPFNYVSTFTTGYKLRGQAIKKFQPQYIQMYSKTDGAASAYKIQGIWDYANNRSSGRWSSEQLVTNALTRFNTIFRRHKIRGHGFALQFKITSVDGQPFDIQGWAVVDTVNAGT